VRDQFQYYWIIYIIFNYLIINLYTLRTHEHVQTSSRDRNSFQLSPIIAILYSETTILHNQIKNQISILFSILNIGRQAWESEPLFLGISSKIFLELQRSLQDHERSNNRQLSHEIDKRDGSWPGTDVLENKQGDITTKYIEFITRNNKYILSFIIRCHTPWIIN